jgi:hypothetical protein
LIDNELIDNELIDNELIDNELIDNELIDNSLIPDQQVVWTVAGAGALTTAATAISNVANGQELLQDGWDFQLLIYQTQRSPKAFQSAGMCTQLAIPTDMVLSNISITRPNELIDNELIDNFQVSNELIDNELIDNELIDNSPISDQISNATFAVDSGEEIHIALRAFKPASSTLTLQLSNPDHIGEAVFGQAHNPDGTSVGAFFDTTVPEISFSRNPAPNDAGWNKTPVTVTWTVRDAQSGIASKTGCDQVALAHETVAGGTVLTCTAVNGAGLSSEVSVTVKIDLTRPTAATGVAPVPNASGWNNTNVTVTFTGADLLSGVLSCSPSVTLTNEGANQSASGTCTDKAGNVSLTATASGIKIDKTPPTAAITTPASNASYFRPGRGELRLRGCGVRCGELQRANAQRLEPEHRLRGQPGVYRHRYRQGRQYRECVGHLLRRPVQLPDLGGEEPLEFRECRPVDVAAQGQRGYDRQQADDAAHLEELFLAQVGQSRLRDEHDPWHAGAALQSGDRRDWLQRLPLHHRKLVL